MLNGEKLIIRTPNPEQYTELMKVLEKFDYFWAVNVKPTDREVSERWNKHKESTCVRIDKDKHITYGNRSFYQDYAQSEYQGYDVISFEAFMRTYGPKPVNLNSKLIQAIKGCVG